MPRSLAARARAARIVHPTRDADPRPTHVVYLRDDSARGRHVARVVRDALAALPLVGVRVVTVSAWWASGTDPLLTDAQLRRLVRLVVFGPRCTRCLGRLPADVANCGPCAGSGWADLRSAIRLVTTSDSEDA